MTDETKGQIIRTVFGSGFGLLAMVIVHIVSWLISAVVIAVIVILIGGGVAALAGPEVIELSTAVGLFLAVMFWPITLLLAIVGVVVAVDIILELFLRPIILALLFGLILGGAAGYFYRQPLWQQRPYLLGAALGLALNIATLLVLFLWTSSSWTLALLPGYLCLGPIVGVVALFFLRLAFPADDAAALKEKLVSP